MIWKKRANATQTKANIVTNVGYTTADPGAAYAGSVQRVHFELLV